MELTELESRLRFELATSTEDEPIPHGLLAAGQRRARRRVLRRRAGGAIGGLALVAAVVIGVTRGNGTSSPKVAAGPRDETATEMVVRDKDEHGVTVRFEIPPGWSVADRVLTPHLGDAPDRPWEILSAGTGPLPVNDDSSRCAQYPSAAIAALPVDGVLVSVQSPNDDRVLPARPTTFVDAEQTDDESAQCLSAPKDFRHWFIGFSDRNVPFFAFVAAGTEASAARLAQAWALLDSLEVTARTISATPPASWPLYRDGAHNFSLPIAPGWSRAAQPLAPWLASPGELLSLATVPLTPIPEPGNQAACASEIPKAAVDNIGADDVYIWLGEWRPSASVYGTTPDPRPTSFRDAHWSPLCPLPEGMTAQGTTIRDAGRDFSLNVIFGRDASVARKAEMYEMLDGLQFGS